MLFQDIKQREEASCLHSTYSVLEKMITAITQKAKILKNRLLTKPERSLLKVSDDFRGMQANKIS